MQSEFSGPYPTRESITRERIMDACVRGIAQHGLHNLKVKHIIDSSGISRQTLYNHYRNRNDIIRDAFVREGVRVSEACANEITRYASVEDKFVKGMVFMHGALPRNPIMSQIVLHHREFLDVIGLGTVPLDQFGRLCFAAVIEAHPALEPEFAEISELWSRSVLSFLLFEGEKKRSEQELEDYIRRRLAPGLGLARLGIP